MGVQEIQNNGKTYVISQDQLEELQKKLKEAKTEAERQAILQGIFTQANEKPQQKSETTGGGTVEQVNTAVDQFRANNENIKKLPPEYQENIMLQTTMKPNREKLSESILMIKNIFLTASAQVNSETETPPSKKAE